MALRWKKRPKETGLRSIGAGPRSSVLWDGKKEYATVSAIGGDWRDHKILGWYWVCPTDSVGEYMNTYRTPCDTEDAAKKEAMAWVKERLGSKSK